MKNLFLIAAIAAICFTSCKKDQKVSPSTPAAANSVEQGNINSILNSQFKYLSEIRIYDKSEKYYIDFEIKSNDADVYREGCQKVKNYSLILADKLIEPEGPKPAEGETLSASVQKAPLFITLKNAVIGNAKAVNLVPISTSAKQSDVINSYFYYSYYVLSFQASVYRVINTSAWYSLIADDYAYYGGKYNFISNTTIPPTWYYDFGGVGVSTRMLGHVSTCGVGESTSVIIGFIS